MRSKFERKIAKELTDAGVNFDYEKWSYQYEEPLRKNMASCGDCGSRNLVRSGWYTPDFFIPKDSALHEYKCIIEAKGRFTAADRRKHLAVREAHPDLNIVFLFMRDNKIAKNSKTHYSDWCMENGFDFAIGHPKKEWLE